ncbi:MAG TPA: hypothetical protein DCS07_15330, partial [Bdellovibrionales bacterium]|nr:hypothetical protein [Bdellovibrionales bacterium]
FSLNENKNISCGEGGIVTATSRARYENLFCQHDVSAQYNPVKSRFFVETRPFLGSSMRISEISGAIMRVQLSRLDEILRLLRERKAIYREALAGLRQVRLITGNCSEGDCGSSIRLLCSDPGYAIQAGQALRNAGYLFAPVTTRPAHAAWKWLPLLDKEPAPRGQAPNQMAHFLQSVDVLTRVLRLETDIHKSLAATQTDARSVRHILESL